MSDLQSGPPIRRDSGTNQVSPEAYAKAQARGFEEYRRMQAGADAVGEKIKKLIDEGKSQEQAVAIALDMQRRGEL